MAGRIQTQPRGLLNFLGLKTSGRNADAWPDHVQPTVDATRFYEGALEVIGRETSWINGGAGELYATQTVPDTEAWHIRRFACNYVIPDNTPAHACRVVAMVNPKGSVGFNLLTQPLSAVQLRTGSTSDPVVIYEALELDLYLDAGAQIAWMLVTHTFSAQVDVDVWSLVYRLPPAI